ncbi:putative hydrolase of the HAD superfamily [Robiginitalea myxolifaciens]|uniref:Putative hydrolase of the HAD superfamily n=1 Tax=Robiginitalea myxolifaciens TaxID=400055 RepID=A0A1I6HIB5_9FLAO|nr:YjjG family noncanonical pyrimidine nucleotidase [Robiginitalea myxolifaciens]SFR54201.1 putative hydrolase of the HAD superfamily [Robiginitalea myxolifaciens]
MLKPGVTDVFFDLDHTLWDFEKNSALTYASLFEDYQVDVNLDDFLKVYVPLNRQYWKLFRNGKIGKQALRFRRLRDAFDGIGYRVSDRRITLFSQVYIERLSNHTHLMPGAQDILDYLAPRYRLHIITNGFEEVQHRKLSNSGISEYFAVVMSSEAAGVKKPHPKIFNTALERANVPPEQSLMIGDSLEADIQGALKAGLQTLFYMPPGEEISDFEDYQGPVLGHLHEIKQYL